MPLTIPLETHPVSDSLSTMQCHVDQLIEIVDRLDLRANSNLVHTLANLRKRTATHQLTLTVLGDSRESKSRLIEALLKTTPAKASIPPSIAACTYLAYGPQAECAVTLADSMTARFPLDQLAEFVNEKVPAPQLKKVLIRFPNAALEGGLVVVDTPELSDDLEAFLSCTTTAIADAEACILVVKAGEELGTREVAFLRRMEGNLEKFFFVLESSRSQSVIEREKSLELVKRSLQQCCGLAEPRVALFSSASAEESEGRPGEGTSGTFQAKLLEFARMRWQSSTSNEVAKAAAEVLKQAEAGLNLKEAASLQRVRLRRAIKALDDISRQSAELALASDAAMHTVVTPTKFAAASRTQPQAGVAAKNSSQMSPVASTPQDRSAEPDPEGRGGDWQHTWEPIFTTNVPAVAATILAFPGKSSNTWVAPPAATPTLPYPFSADRCSKDTTAPTQPEEETPVPVPVTAVPRVGAPSPLDTAPVKSAAKDTGLPIHPRMQEAGPAFAPRVFPEPFAPTLGWRANRDSDPDDELDDENEATGGGVALARRLAGIAVLFAAVLTISWAVVVVLRPDLRQMGPLQVAAALSAPLRSGKLFSSMVHIAAQTADAKPAGSNNADAAADSSQPPEHFVPPLPAAPQTPPTAQPSATAQPAPPMEAKPVPAPAIADGEKTALEPEQAAAGEQPGGMPRYTADPENSGQDAALESALERWIKASRSGNVPAQAASYAPVVGTYFNSRNVTRAQVQAEEERAATGTAGIQNYRITTIGISTASNGQKAALVQKDWNTPTGQGAGFAATEFERLLFAQVDGQWKIVGEQEIKLHQTRGSHRAANFAPVPHTSQ